MYLQFRNLYNYTNDKQYYIGLLLLSNSNKSTLDNSPPPLLNLKLLRQQGQIIDKNAKNHNKSAILIFSQPLLNISNMHNKFGKDT